MTDNKEVKIITTNHDKKQQDDKEEDKNNNDELTKVLEDMDTFKYCKTDILHNVKFMSKMDKFVFDSLPLTNSQKEELLLSLFSVAE